jgi:hypothetical protein
MIIQYKDYNSADKLISQSYAAEWNEILTVLQTMPLHLKASDQKGKQGNPIFDPVGTNSYIKKYLIQKEWSDNIPLGKELDFLGTDVDFGKNGIILEAQFSNYPFLLNNIIRSEVLFKSQFIIGGKPSKILFVITKAHMFPASNSTLYYEQAIGQIDFLDNLNIFEIPVRLIGLLEQSGDSVPAIWTTYKDPRYSRTITDQTDIRCSIRFPEGNNATKRRAVIEKNSSQRRII